jgi:hypothetical protein
VTNDMLYSIGPLTAHGNFVTSIAFSGIDGELIKHQINVHKAKKPPM